MENNMENNKLKLDDYQEIEKLLDKLSLKLKKIVKNNGFSQKLKEKVEKEL